MLYKNKSLLQRNFPRTTTSCFLLVSFLLLTGCCRDILSVYTYPLNRSQLASFHVGTPDPLLVYPRIGESLVVEWNLSEACYLSQKISLRITLRFADQTEQTQEIAIPYPRGYYQYFLNGQEFLDKKGILTYKIELLSAGEVLADRHHHLWVERIQIGCNEA